jgi:xanthine/CO dehydrogenase XdhC/CoxF family maturation factor
MRELEILLTAYDEMKSKGLGCVLATVVHVEGSSYRQAGARMLVNENGEMTGAISGGCLEGDALKKALLALEQGQNKLITYDTSDENDAVIGAQLGCNGIIQVLFEPVDPEHADNPVELIRRVISGEETRVMITLFNLQKRRHQPGTRMIIDQRMNHAGNVGDIEFLNILKADAGTALSQNTSLFKEYHVSGEIHHAFIELHQSAPTLVLVGAGNDAQVLAQMATITGWKVIVTDGRSTHANYRRFQASCQVFVSEPEKTLDNIRIDHRTAFVLMTHNYQYDLAVLKLLIHHAEIPYIGLLGPKKKYQRMLDELRNQDFQLSKEITSKIYAPVGLDLGAETPSEIGLSVLSEILAVLNNAGASHLRERTRPIHEKSNYRFKVEHV